MAGTARGLPRARGTPVTLVTRPDSLPLSLTWTWLPFVGKVEMSLSAIFSNFRNILKSQSVSLGLTL